MNFAHFYKNVLMPQLNRKSCWFQIKGKENRKEENCRVFFWQNAIVPVDDSGFTAAAVAVAPPLLPPRAWPPLLEDKEAALDHLLLLPLFFSLCSETLGRAAHGRYLTEPPPHAAVDRSIPEQIELGQNHRRALLFLLPQAIELGRPASTRRSRFLRRRPPRRRNDSGAVQAPPPPPSSCTCSG